MSFRRFGTTHYRGSSGPGAAANHYSISVWRRGREGILAVYVTRTVADAIKLVRLLIARYPARLVGISRIQYTRHWIAAPYQAPVGVPDYKGSRWLSLYTKKGRWPNARWTKRDERPNVLEALQ